MLSGDKKTSSSTLAYYHRIKHDGIDMPAEIIQNLLLGSAYYTENSDLFFKIMEDEELVILCCMPMNKTYYADGFRDTVSAFFRDDPINDDKATQLLEKRQKEGTFLSLPINDKKTDAIEKYFDESFDFIDKALKKGKKVLVHCLQGLSRSPALVIAYLLMNKEHNYSFEEAIKLVTDKRPWIMMHLNFIESLKKLKKPDSSTTILSKALCLQLTLSDKTDTATTSCVATSKTEATASTTTTSTLTTMPTKGLKM